MASNATGMTPLHRAMNYGPWCSKSPRTAEEAIRAMREALKLPNLDVNQKNNDRKTALHVLLDDFQSNRRPNCHEVLKEFLSLAEGLELDVEDRYWCTPLIKALQCGHIMNPNDVTLVRLIVEAGANVNFANNYGSGCPPLLMAAGWSNEHEDHNALCIERVKILIDAGADIKAQDDCGKNVLHWPPSAAVGKFLIDNYGEDIKECIRGKDDRGDTPLHAVYFQSARAGTMRRWRRF